MDIGLGGRYAGDVKIFRDGFRGELPFNSCGGDCSCFSASCLCSAFSNLLSVSILWVCISRRGEGGGGYAGGAVGIGGRGEFGGREEADEEEAINCDKAEAGRGSAINGGTDVVEDCSCGDMLRGEDMAGTGGGDIEGTGGKGGEDGRMGTIPMVLGAEEDLRCWYCRCS